MSQNAGTLPGLTEHCKTVENILPLKEGGATLRDVMEFWAASSFDLRLRQGEGNCDLCFLKGTKQLLGIIQTRPDLLDWWITQEALPLATQAGGVAFRKDRTYTGLAAMARELNAMDNEAVQMLNIIDNDLGECRCHD